jgi:hypothetical protein
MALKNPKNFSKTQNQPEIKKSYQEDMCFSWQFQGKKT